jgi:hypothetical protein
MENAMDKLQVTQTVQRVINADPSDIRSILAFAPVDIQEEVRRQFCTNQKLRLLFPEYAGHFKP